MGDRQKGAFRTFCFEKTSIQGLTLIHPPLFEDERGYYMKRYEKRTYEENGIFFTPHEEAQSRSMKGVIRGMHFQIEHPQAKLVRIAKGEAFDVAIDLRFGSPTFGKWQGFYLSEKNGTMLYIPEGFAHGMMALEDDTLLCYASGDDYSPKTDGGVCWDDPDIGILWPLERVPKPILSEKDRSLPTLRKYLKLL